MTTREQDLEAQLKAITMERNELHAKLTDSRLSSIEKDVLDHESRLRSLEIIGTRSNVLYALSAGGGAIGIIVLIKTLLGTP